MKLHIPKSYPTDEEALEIFIEWTFEQGLELYPAQEEAILEVLSGQHVILSTPTGSGKSLVAVAMHFRGLCYGQRSVYTAPIKALVSEKFFSLCKTFGAENVGMLTGDAAINRDAPVLCCTAEVLSNMVLREGERVGIDYVVMDEFHYYADRDRGMAWQVPLLTMPDTRFLLMSATLGDTSGIEEQILERTGREVVRVHSDDRPVPLEFEYRDTPIHITLDELVKAGRAPIYVVSFSQREAADQAQAQTSVKFSSSEDKARIAQQLKGVKFDSPYGKDMMRFLKAGIGLHHAGLLPKYRLLVEQLAQQGLLKVINGTDTLGVGVNIPLRTVLFTKLCKFDGVSVRILSVRNFKQIAGRAGRKGFDDRGWVVCQAPEHVIENMKLATRASQTGKKKYTKKQPPKKGYVPWNEATFRRLVDGRPEPLESVFQVDQGVLLNLLQRVEADGLGAGYRALVRLIGRSHQHAGNKRHLRRGAAQLFKALRRAGIVEVARGERGTEVLVSEDLQDDFSLHHTLSLYVIDAIQKLDAERETYAADVTTLVESILESPRAILMRQVSKIKGDLVGEMKAEGIPYEERMERLEEVTWPRPNKEWIWQTFEQFAEHHPWVKTEHIRPKSIARDMYERYCTFDEYVREYGLQRMEGVVLRYLSQAYKGVIQNVPMAYKNDEVYDAIAFLRTVLARVDSSLIAEWERLHGVETGMSPADDLPERARVPAIDANPRVFAARVRAELHTVVRALSGRQFEAAARSVRQPEGDPWPPERFEQALEPFLEENERLVFDHRARLTDKTTMIADGDRRWRVTQTLCTPDLEDDTWALEGLIDLSERDPEDFDSPLVQVVGLIS